MTPAHCVVSLDSQQRRQRLHILVEVYDSDQLYWTPGHCESDVAAHPASFHAQPQVVRRGLGYATVAVVLAPDTDLWTPIKAQRLG